jgi:hypothetical protein
MHFHFDFSAGQILWTLTFAAILVLLVVLLGRDRARRFPWFTASILLTALNLLASRLLFGRLSSLTMNTIMIVLGNIEALAGLLVLVELARRAFAGTGRRNWIVGTAALLALGGVVLAIWKPWLPWQRLVANPRVAALNVMLVVAAPRDTLPVATGLAKGNLLVCSLTVGLALLIVVFGRRFHAGWRSHVQQIVVGLSACAIAWLLVQGVWQIIARTVQIRTRVEYEHIVGLGDKLINANRTIYLAALVWWIASLWIDEPCATASAPAKGAPVTAEASFAPEAPSKEGEIAASESSTSPTTDH